MVPTATPAMIRQEPTPVTMRIAAPIRHASAEVSPSEPGSRPMNAFIHERPRAASPNGTVKERIVASRVAPEKPSTAFAPFTATHTVSPEISAGYAKNMNARPARAGLRKFIPVPPKTSFAITTPKLMPSAACHRGAVAGSVRGKMRPVTRKPSLISWRRTIAKRTSQDPPTAMVTA